jgi:uncharacterized protein DUF4386
MTPTRLSRTAMGAAMLLAPLAGVIAAVADPALRDDLDQEIAAIAAHHGRYYVYALAVMISGYLLVPAFLGVLALLRDRATTWSTLAGGLAIAGLLVAVGDGAGELLYWQMGSPRADHAQMVALADRYENALGSSLPYTIGGLATLVGVLLISVALWRTGAVPRWAAVGLVVGSVANVVGFSAASRPTLLASYVVLLAAFVPMAQRLFGPADRPAMAARRSAAPAQAT